MKFSRSEIEANGTTIIPCIKKHGKNGKSKLYKYITNVSYLDREEIDFFVDHMVKSGW